MREAEFSVTAHHNKGASLYTVPRHLRTPLARSPSWYISLVVLCLPQPARPASFFPPAAPGLEGRIIKQY
ncbi:hypothetical protein E2C01_022080 [Portunus trituberculatus]|uniref:Uncharacterized protein n=1 Tax=Portunus trituberculatus TaxID=210409 RepID=A0A5B7E6A2_PORTR|nr:hypothetical protein [Portunus trituberculatus]